MSFEGRPRILQYAYDSTLRDLDVQGDQLQSLLARYARNPVAAPERAVPTPVDLPLAGNASVVR